MVAIKALLLALAVTSVTAAPISNDSYAAPVPNASYVDNLQARLFKLQKYYTNQSGPNNQMPPIAVHRAEGLRCRIDHPNERYSADPEAHSSTVFTNPENQNEYGWLVGTLEGVTQDLEAAPDSSWPRRGELLEDVKAFI